MCSAMQKNGEKQILIDKAKKSADNLFTRNQFINWATHPDNPDRISLESAQLHASRFLALLPGLVKNHDVENINTTFDLMEKIIKKRIDENGEREWELKALADARSGFRLYAKFVNSILTESK